MSAALELTNAAVPGRLHETTLELERGKLVALVGPNGSGKSTLLQFAAGVLSGAGEVKWGGRTLKEIAMLERGRCAAWVPQEAHFEFGFTVRAVVAQGRFAHGDDGCGVDEALRRFDLVGLAERPVTQLSGGERQRVLLARALVTEAPLQLWDEPLAALDVRHALETLRLAAELARAGKTLLLSIHDLRVVDRFDAVAVMHAGKLNALGKPGDVLTPERVSEVFGVRARTVPGMTLELP